MAVAISVDFFRALDPANAPLASLVRCAGSPRAKRPSGREVVGSFSSVTRVHRAKAGTDTIFWRARMLQSLGCGSLMSEEVQSTCLITASASLAVSLDFGMDNTHVAGKSIIARERLLFTTQRTANFLLAVVVNGILMAC